MGTRRTTMMTGQRSLRPRLGVHQLRVVILAAALSGASLSCGADKVPQSQEAEAEVVATRGGAAEDAPAQDVAVVLDGLNDYWSEVDDEFGFSYEPVPDDRISTGDDGVTCDGEEVAAADVADNAFVDAGCAEGILVAYDPDYLAEGVATMEATLAHEWGHVIQAQAAGLDLGLDADGLPVDSELQADCFSGAWVAERGTATLAELRADLADAADPGEVDIEEPDAHGDAEDRTLAFDLGYERGPLACVDDLIDRLPG